MARVADMIQTQFKPLPVPPLLLLCLGLPATGLRLKVQEEPVRGEPINVDSAPGIPPVAELDVQLPDLGIDSLGTDVLVPLRQ
jgi:hypothetical protein